MVLFLLQKKKEHEKKRVKATSHDLPQVRNLRNSLHNHVPQLFGDESEG